MFLNINILQTEWDQMSEWRLPEEGAYDECGAVRSGRFFDAQQIRQVQWSTVERAREPEIRDLPQESAWVLSQPDEQRFWPRLQTTCLFYCNKYVGSTTDLCCIRHAQLNVNTFFFEFETYTYSSGALTRFLCWFYV